MVKIQMELDFSDLQKQCWSGAIQTLEVISANDLEDEFMSYLEEALFMGELPTMTELNDYLWFDADQIFEDLGMNENVEDEEE